MKIKNALPFLLTVLCVSVVEKIIQLKGIGRCRLLIAHCTLHIQYFKIELVKIVHGVMGKEWTE